MDQLPNQMVWLQLRLPLHLHLPTKINAVEEPVMPCKPRSTSIEPGPEEPQLGALSTTPLRHTVFVDFYECCRGFCMHLKIALPEGMPQSLRRAFRKTCRSPRSCGLPKPTTIWLTDSSLASTRAAQGVSTHTTSMIKLIEKTISSFLDEKFNPKSNQPAPILDTHYIKLPFYGHLSYIIRILNRIRIPKTLISNIIYEFECSSCKARYIGETEELEAEQVALVSLLSQVLDKSQRLLGNNEQTVPDTRALHSLDSICKQVAVHIAMKKFPLHKVSPNDLCSLKELRNINAYTMSLESEIYKEISVLKI
ncbi:hypothetical protein GWK47_044664 [Chionoecetes opilio]|uniref:Uncharacterized protein n=1 Tax=Chionoecetes opilio TaxID=41210 RepID=A0A8J4YFL2_CHIOP|nr:hypothetical protein GWK47_044664 [Chionoecetes opilio]